MSGAPAKAKGKPDGRARGRPRTGARVAAVQALFQSEQTGEPAETVLDQFLRHRLTAPGADGGYEDGKVPEADARLFTRILRAAAQEGEKLDGLIAPLLSKGWTMDRLDPVLRALLRAAAAELNDPAEPPARVVINEYLDIAHGFFGGEEPRFCNGVLDALARALRAEEF